VASSGESAASSATAAVGSEPSLGKLAPPSYLWGGTFPPHLINVKHCYSTLGFPPSPYNPKNEEGGVEEGSLYAVRYTSSFSSLPVDAGVGAILR